MEILKSESFYPAFNFVSAIVTRANGEVENIGIAKNMRSTAGASWYFNTLTGTQVGVMAFIALSSTIQTLALSDTTLSGEITMGGLARAAVSVGSYVPPSSVSGVGQSWSCTFSKSFTCTAGPLTVNSAGIFNLAAAGVLILESNFATTTTLQTNDVISCSWVLTS